MKSRTPDVPWRDLVALSPLEKLWELTLCWPWLALSIVLYAQSWWWAGALASFYFFLTGLRQSHNAQHYSLGVARWIQDVVLAVLSVAMLASMHAVQVTHLHHHRHCLEPEDVEGSTARMPWWRTLLTGPLFPLRLHRAAWRLGDPVKSHWIAMELVLIALWCAVVWFVFDWPALQWHTAAMLLGECCTGFFAVWTVHHDSDDHHRMGRTQRGRWINAVTYSMFFHAEHHLYPAVPTIHLSELARRLDLVAPSLQTHRVLGRTGSDSRPRNRPLATSSSVPQFARVSARRFALADASPTAIALDENTNAYGSCQLSRMQQAGIDRSQGVPGLRLPRRGENGRGSVDHAGRRSR